LDDFYARGLAEKFFGTYFLTRKNTSNVVILTNPLREMDAQNPKIPGASRQFRDLSEPSKQPRSEP